MAGDRSLRREAIASSATPTKPGKVTVAGHLNNDLHPKIKASIMKQAGLWQ